MYRNLELCTEEELFEMLSQKAKESVDHLYIEPSTGDLIVVLKYDRTFKDYCSPSFYSHFKGRAGCVSTIGELKKLTKLSNIHKKTAEEIKEDVRQELEKLSRLWKMTPEEVYTRRGEEVKKRMINNASHGWCYTIKVFDSILEKELCKEFLKSEEFQSQLAQSFKEAKQLSVSQAN